MTLENMEFDDLLEVEAKLGEALALPFTNEHLIVDKEGRGAFYWSYSLEQTKHVFDSAFSNAYKQRHGAHIVTMKRYPRFTQSMDAAMKIVDRLHALQICWVRMEYKSAIFADDWNRMGWQVIFRAAHGRPAACIGYSTSLPIAICQATWDIYQEGWITEVKQ
jgi:hypothetical protein